MAFVLPRGREKAQYVYKQFERIANRYDLGNDIISLGMHRWWKREAVDRLSCATDGKYLDVCCGTGDVALRIAHELNGTGSITGLDFSQRMLMVARCRAASRLHKTMIDWLKGDAQNLPFEDHLFDGAIISFGLRNLSDFDRGIAEMVRVTKPGGKVVNLDLGHPRAPLFTPMFNFYFATIVPLLGQIIQSDRVAYTYLPESVKSYPKPEGITEIFKRAGLVEINYRELAGGSVALHWGTVK